MYGTLPFSGTSCPCEVNPNRGYSDAGLARFHAFRGANVESHNDKQIRTVSIRILANTRIVFIDAVGPVNLGWHGGSRDTTLFWDRLPVGRQFLIEVTVKTELGRV